MAMASSSAEEIRSAQRAYSPAMVLAIGTAVPVNCVYQVDYPDFLFRVSKSEHLTSLKDKLKRMCEKSMIRKRHFHMTEEMLQDNPTIATFMAPSINERQKIVLEAVPKLGKEAAVKAIKEWGQPISRITHLVFTSTTGVHLPASDYQLAKLLGLSHSVKRLMLYPAGCNGGGVALQVAKDLAENNRGSRVLLVSSEVTAFSFQGPSETHLGTLVGQALFSDGAGAVIIGADPEPIERPIFQLILAAQTTIPDTEHAIDGHLGDYGLMFDIAKKVPSLVSSSIEKSLVEALRDVNPNNNFVGRKDWNSLFWGLHPGGRAILDKVQAKLGLHHAKLDASRRVLSEYGNIASASLFFVMDEMRKKSMEERKATTGDGLEWGVLVGLGPGVTMETIVVRSAPLLF